MKLKIRNTLLYNVCQAFPYCLLLYWNTRAKKANKEIMTHLNEDKRRIESHQTIFKIYNDIEGCPPHLVSSKRRFISKCEVIELSDSLVGRGEILIMYLFSDIIEICKKRTHRAHTHIKLISLNDMQYVVDITDNKRAFGIICCSEYVKFYKFLLANEDCDKMSYLHTLCKQLAATSFCLNTDMFMLERTSQEANVDVSVANLSTMNKAVKLPTRARLKLESTLSKSRGVSAIMSETETETETETPNKNESRTKKLIKRLKRRKKTPNDAEDESHNI